MNLFDLTHLTIGLMFWVNDLAYFCDLYGHSTFCIIGAILFLAFIDTLRIEFSKKGK